MDKLERILNALMVLTLTGVLLSAFGVQIIEHEEPCPLCMLQRLGMIAASVGALCNLRFGVRMSHYALILLSSIFGGFVALRQISLHVCPGFPKFGLPVLGLSLYTWSFVVFVCLVLAVSILLFLYDPKKHETEPTEQSKLSQIAFWAILFVVVANVFSTLWQCGLGPCEG